MFFATAPWPVFYSIAALESHPDGVLRRAVVLGAWNVITQSNSRNIFWVCVLLGIMPQFHMVVVFLCRSSCSPVVDRSRSIGDGWRLGILASALYIPYILGEMRHGWSNTHAILGGHAKLVPGVLKALILPFTNLSNLISSITGDKFADYRAFGDACFGSCGFSLRSTLCRCSRNRDDWQFPGRHHSVILRKNWPSPRRAFAVAPADIFIGLLLFLPPLLFIASLSNFSSRYLIVGFPLLFLLPALLVVRTPATSRWRKPIVAALVVTIVFNVWLTLASFHYQGTLIETGDHFLPSFRKMEMVRQRLKADAGPDNRVQIDQAPLLAQKKRWTEAGAVTLADYIDLRETYDPLNTATRGVKTYHVQLASDNVPTNERVAYAGNGLVIVTSN